MSGSVEQTQNSILRMSDDKTMQLIELYEKEDCLWNTQLEDYKNREKRARAAENIARILNVPNFESRHVVIKFKNLRNSYCQELKKIAHSLNSGVGPEEVYRPKVFWFPKMHSFLRPHLQPSRNSCLPPWYNNIIGSCLPPSTIPLDQVKKEPENEQEETWVQMTNPEDVLIPETSLEQLENSGTENEESFHLDSRKCRKRTKPMRNPFKRPKPQNTTENSMSSSLNDISAQLHLLTNREEDYYDNFGKYIASLLRSLPQQKAYHLQPRIVSLITNEGFPQEAGRVSQSDEL